MKRSAGEASDTQPPAKKAKECVPNDDLPDFAFNTQREVEIGGDDNDNPHPRSLKELRLMSLSGSIRDKPNWREKLTNPEIVAKWATEAKQQGFVESAWNYCLAELAFFASKTTASGSDISLAAVEEVYQRDIPLQIKHKLTDEVRRLENVPDNEKDWHPGSNNQVLDLVHPSLYCYVYGVSRLSTEPDPGYEHWESWIGTGEPHDELPEKSYSFSNQYQWLPSDIHVSEDGKVKFNSYINNLHPQRHEGLYRTLEQVLELIVPMWNHVLTDITHPSAPRFIPSSDWYTEERDYDNDDDDDEDRRVASIGEEWEKFEIPQNEKDRINVNLRGRDLQVIVKLANIELTPENPEYPGGVWHIEGMENESIVASGIYYYQCDNIKDSHLAFRCAVGNPEDYEQCDYNGVEQIYGLKNEEPAVQPMGAVTTCENRCIAFPNTLQHQVQPFSLLDALRPGSRKILVFFLINPKKPIISTMYVPPQQPDWYRQEIRKTEVLDLLPAEIQEKILQQVYSVMTKEEAVHHREQLMKERKVFQKDNNKEFYEREVSLCEH